MQVNRRQFFKLSAASLGGSTLTALGFSPNEALAEVRTFKLTRTTETRNAVRRNSGTPRIAPNGYTGLKDALRNESHHSLQSEASRGMRNERDEFRPVA